MTTRRLLQLTVKACCLCAGLWILGSSVPQTQAQEVWIRKGPFFYSNGRDDKPRNATVTNNSLSSTDGSGRPNRITWSVPPATLVVGQEVVLTLESTTNPGAPLIGAWRAKDCGEREATVRDGSAASFAGYKQGEPFNQGKLVFKWGSRAAGVIRGARLSIRNTGSSQYYLMRVRESGGSL